MQVLALPFCPCPIPSPAPHLPALAVTSIPGFAKTLVMPASMMLCAALAVVAQLGMKMSLSQVLRAAFMPSMTSGVDIHQNDVKQQAPPH